MDKHIFLIAYAYSLDGKGYIERLYIEPDAENVANFIMKHRDVKVVITTELDLPYIEAEGGFIQSCVDTTFLLDELHPAIMPIQLGEKEVGTVREYYIEDIEESE